MAQTITEFKPTTFASAATWTKVTLPKGTQAYVVHFEGTAGYHTTGADTGASDGGAVGANREPIPADQSPRFACTRRSHGGSPPFCYVASSSGTPDVTVSPEMRL